MAKLFTDCADRTMLKFDKLLEQESGGGRTIELDLESEFSNLALDIIGLGVFNYDFGSVTTESPVIKDASLLRFLVDVDDRQLRDDLMTMLIAGHETTAAVLTWAVFLLAQDIGVAVLARVSRRRRGSMVERHDANASFQNLDSLDTKCHSSMVERRSTNAFCRSRKASASVTQRPPPVQKQKKTRVRIIIIVFPHPIVIKAETLFYSSGGYNGDKDGYEIPVGTDFFLSIISDFALLPFGGGPRKCVGDQFALMESTIALSMLLQNVALKGSPEDVELVTGATIHKKTGLWCKLKKRSNV
ncbi:hypothetical protein RND71_008516 [Anisodus tanguticus]|uniref:Cytochrome P450 n=1 Tax=Anisodus tanguticus TaxID=243964 RepID=A0AAE1VL38_9SOLA|nr:hypothetical protein RND71_008516 [Anisodus tanguticus]